MNADVMESQLEVWEHQNELINEVQQKRDDVANEKERKEKPKLQELPKWLLVCL